MSSIAANVHAAVASQSSTQTQLSSASSEDTQPRMFLAPSRIGHINVADRYTRKIVHPAVNLAHVAAPDKPAYSATDSILRDTIVSSTQISLGILPAAAAIENFVGLEVSPFHPKPGIHVGAALGCTALSVLGFSVGGAFIGAHIAAPLLQSKRTFADLVGRHERAASRGAHVGAVVAGAAASALGVAGLVAEAAWVQHNENMPTPMWLREAATFGVAFLYGAPGCASAGWYLGSVVGAGLADVVDRLHPQPAIALPTEEV